jgi:hypothetical protein
MIPKQGDITSFDKSNVPVLKQIIDGIVQETERTVYRDTVPTAADLEIGTRAIVDDGAAIKRIYYLTGKGRLGYINLT